MPRRIPLVAFEERFQPVHAVTSPPSPGKCSDIILDTSVVGRPERVFVGRVFFPIQGQPYHFPLAAEHIVAEVSGSLIVHQQSN